MKRILLTSLSMAALAATLSACATPQYPVTQGYVPPPPMAPEYSNRAPATQTAQFQPESPAPSLPAPPADDPPAASAAPSPATVQSSALSPISTEPSPAPADQPANAAASAPPPAAATPPPAPRPAPPAATPRPAPYSPPPAASAAPRRLTPVVRYVTDGRVVAAKGMYRDYVVQKGDHLDAIARDLHTTRRELVAANRLGESYAIRPGRHLKVPVAKAYVAVGGDTLGGVAKRFGVGLAELANLNDLPERGRLTPGMFIALPDAFEDHGPQRVTVSEEAYAAPRPRAVYRPAPPASRPATASLPPASNGYVPSQYALAAAAAARARAAQPVPNYASPAYAPSRPPEPPAANQAAMVSAGAGRFVWPVRGQILSSFGVTGVGRRNDGVDIGAAAGAPVAAAASGEVVYAGDQVPGFGNLVLIKHASGWVSAYAHLGTVIVKMRQMVYQGEPLGTVGMTGGVGAPQLHFEIRYAATPSEKARPVDPVLVLPR
jgi:murein DD-endopeptidase MepM/ murein hydrolase activator NlpD